MSELAFVLRLSRGGTDYAMDGAIPLEGVTAIVGPSGSGKTTLLMMLAGLEPQARGEITFDGRAWLRGRRRLPPEARRIGFVFQDGRLFDHLTVAENLAYGARRRGVEPASVHGVIDAMGLQHLLDRRPPTLSGGEARRVAVGRALATRPDILFMDEPLSGLDDEAKADLLPPIARAVSEAGVPAVYVTHARAEVTRLADRVLRVEEGRIAGWDAAPTRLDVRVEATRAGRVTVVLGETRFELRGRASPGDARRIALPPEAVLLSRDPPGPSAALAVFRVTVAETRRRPGLVELDLACEGQRFDWRVPAGSALGERPPAPGEWLWLTLLDAQLR